MAKQILVIEDNERNLYLVTYLLEHHGFVVHAALDGATGIARAIELTPDLVVLDIQLPTMDGYEVAQKLRAHAPLATTPIVAVTSYAMVGDREKALALGCSAYIEKPIDPLAFVSQIQALL